MKDYTKYDFAAIVGAKVEIHYHAGEPLIARLIHFDSETKIITLLAEKENDLPVGFIHVREISSLSAKITPRRMNLEQLKRFAEDEAKQENADEWSLTIDKKGLSFDFSSEGHKGIGVYINVDQPLSCTDWGWEK